MKKLLLFLLPNLLLAYKGWFNLLVPFSITMAALGLVWLAGKLLRLGEEQRKNLLLIPFGIFVALSLMETVLFCIGGFNTYMEKVGQSWASPYRLPPASRKWFWVRGAGEKYEADRQEFDYPRTCNSLGLPDVEHPFQKDSNEIRILALGDSWTEGVGAPADSSWPSLLQKMLNERNPARHYRVMNGGVSGSDPFFGYILAKERMLPYRPDFIYITINTSDVSDVMIRGGMERFGPDSTLIFKKGPFLYEQAYRCSRLFRLINHNLLGRDEFYMTPAEKTQATEEALGKIAALMVTFQDWCTEHGIGFKVIVHPAVNEMEERRIDFLSALLPVLARAKVPVCNLLEKYSQIPTFQSKEGIKEMYWPIDGHHTPKGYAAFAASVAAD